MTNRFLVWSKAANEVPCGGHSGIGLAARPCSLDVRFLGIPVSNQYRKRRYAGSVPEMSPLLNRRIECDTGHATQAPSRAVTAYQPRTWAELFTSRSATTP